MLKWTHIDNNQVFSFDPCQTSTVQQTGDPASISVGQRMKDHFFPSLGAYSPHFTLRLTPTCEKTLTVDILLYLFCEEAEDFAI